MSDAPSLVIVTPEVYHIYGEGAEGTINGPVKGDTFDIKRQKAGNLLSSTRLVTSVQLAGISWILLENLLSTRMTSSSSFAPTATRQTQE